MDIASYDVLDFDLAWKRLLKWARDGQIDTTDRLPFEAMDKLYPGSPPRVDRTHHLRPVEVIFGNKKDGLFRPFCRIHTADLLLYQALVDRLADDLEAALGSREQIFAYRQLPDAGDDPFEGSPRWKHFAEAVVQSTRETAFGFVLATDVSGHFMNLDLDLLDQQLRKSSTQHDVISDLTALLRMWQLLGVRGLPQGMRASSVLGNLSLVPIDEYLRSQGLHFHRYMDDLYVFTAEFAQARDAQEGIERVLYGMGLSLASGKTQVLNTARIRETFAPAGERLDRTRADAFEGMVRWLTEYEEPTDEDLGRAEVAALAEAADGLYGHLEEGALPEGFRSDVTELLRRMEREELAHRLEDLSKLLYRLPDLFPLAVRYLSRVAHLDQPAAQAVFIELFDPVRHLRDLDKLHLIRGLLTTRNAMPQLAPQIVARFISEDSHPLVHARGLLAWGRHSAENDFSETDKFWANTRSEWRPYAVVAIQGKSNPTRAERLSAWGGEGRFIDKLCTWLAASRSFPWSKL